MPESSWACIESHDEKRLSYLVVVIEIDHRNVCSNALTWSSMAARASTFASCCGLFSRRLATALSLGLSFKKEDAGTWNRRRR